MIAYAISISCQKKTCISKRIWIFVSRPSTYHGQLYICMTSRLWWVKSRISYIIRKNSNYDLSVNYCQLELCNGHRILFRPSKIRIRYLCLVVSGHVIRVMFHQLYIHQLTMEWNLRYWQKIEFLNRCMSWIHYGSMLRMTE